jgi:hypothetical protein
VTNSVTECQADDRVDSSDCGQYGTAPLASDESISVSTQFQFVVFTCRDPRSDFRLPLVEALRGRYETYYIWLKRRPVVTTPDAVAAPMEMSLPAFLCFVRRIRADRRVNIYFNSTNTSFPGFTLVLQWLMRPGVWCLDMHDDLKYHYAGFRRVREKLAIVVLQATADVIVHAAPTLKELFPRSHRLGNASHLMPVSHDGVGFQNVLVLASFDERFDVDFLSRLAALSPATAFHLHGWTRRDDPITPKLISDLVAQRSNVHYHGPYILDDLPRILAAYRVSVAPYRTNSILTRYIDPLRFYHCLNAGLEVLSTDVPQARFMQDAIHVVQDPADCARTLAAIQQGPLARQPSYSPVTWKQRMNRLVAILEALPRTKSLAAAQSATISATLPAPGNPDV